VVSPGDAATVVDVGRDREMRDAAVIRMRHTRGRI
jgi:hypothetical protein